MLAQRAHTLGISRLRRPKAACRSAGFEPDPSATGTPRRGERCGTVLGRSAKVVNSGCVEQGWNVALAEKVAFRLQDGGRARALGTRDVFRFGASRDRIGASLKLLDDAGRAVEVDGRDMRAAPGREPQQVGLGGGCPAKV